MDLKSFVIELTADGSPTLRLKSSNALHPEKMPESMHHSGGAAAETLYIYTGPFKNTLQALSELKQNQLSVGVVGLGLGYIELSVLQNLAANPAISANLTSFEKEAELVEAFTAWLNGKENKTYDLICEKLSADKNKIQNYSRLLDWKKLGELTAETSILQPFHFIAYDAFSQFTDGPLWTDEFLDFFLTQLCAKDCVFATYACTGNLKRALQRNGFLFIKRPGFSGKRDATLALRGEFIALRYLFQSV
ncbi:MAG: MnmC family methyltransferase [Pseudobdellovibrio sp.]|nr:MnmC family methyltransferase [Pseudobdellovibrio sp.]